MRVSHKHKFIFLANPRTGSTSVRNILDHHSDVKSVHISKIDDDFPFYHHISALELKNIFEKKGWKWSDYHKFCVVRNPWDRIASLYHWYLKYRVQTAKIEDKRLLKNLLIKAKSKIRPANLSFKDYVIRLNPQSRLSTSLEYFIFDDQEHCLVENVLKFESLNLELSEYLNNLNISMSANDIPHLNSSQDRQNYRKYYDDETREVVSNIYADEIEQFGYSF